MHIVPDFGDFLEGIHKGFLRDPDLVDTCAGDGQVRVGLGDMVPHSHVGGVVGSVVVNWDEPSVVGAWERVLQEESIRH